MTYQSCYTYYIVAVYYNEVVLPSCTFFEPFVNLHGPYIGMHNVEESHKQNCKVKKNN